MILGTPKEPVALTNETIADFIAKAREALDAQNVPSYGRKLYYYRDGKEVIFNCDTGKEEQIRDIQFAR